MPDSSPGPQTKSRSPLGYVVRSVRKLGRRLRPMPEPYRSRFNMKLAQWMPYHQNRIVIDHCYWMGVKAQKNPCDAWIYQEIIYEVKPDVIIEIGSREGGTTLYFANLLDLLGKGQVISIEIDRSDYHLRHDRIVEFTGDSSSDAIVLPVHELCRGKSVLVIHDGDHTRKQVIKDLRAYHDLVSVGSYLIIEDGVIDLFRPGDGIGMFEAGPLAATEEFLADHPNFVVDSSRERYIMTYNPRGFLKRVR